MRLFRASGAMFLFTTLVLGIGYPMAMHGIGSLLWSPRIHGSLLHEQGICRGAFPIGQQWQSPKYFHGRPSASAYGALPSGASNAEWIASSLRDSVLARQQRWAAASNVALRDVPPELLFSSGSGLDPHISPEAARIQIPRIARVRAMDPARISMLVSRMTVPASVLLGAPSRVNVLALNVALDSMGIR